MTSSCTDERIPSTPNTNEPPSPVYWGYVMVFPNFDYQLPHTNSQHSKRFNESTKLLLQLQQIVCPTTLDTILWKLKHADLQFRLFYSSGKQFIFCKIGATEKRLQSEAARIELQLQLNPIRLSKIARKGLLQYGIHPFPIVDVKHTFRYAPYDFIFSPYVIASQYQSYFLRSGPTKDSLFDSSNRKILIENIITSDPSVNGAGCHLDRLRYDGTILECFPLHEDSERKILQKEWVQWNMAPMMQPFGKIKAYFGVKIALYFMYLGHYTQWLTLPAVIGLIVGVLAWKLPISMKPYVFMYLLPAFGIFMNIWAAVYLKNWKRLNAHASLRWGVSKIKERPYHLRPQFRGEIISSPIDGSLTKYFCPKQKWRRVAFSWLVISLLILIVFFLVSCIFYLRYDLTKGSDSIHLVVANYRVGPMLAAVANVVQITIMTRIYNHFSIRLNDQENHRTDVEYENSLILKTVIFQFVNNFSGLFYSAFIKNGLEGCENLDCLYELEYILMIIYCSRLVWGNVTEVLLPRFWAYVKRQQLLTSQRYCSRRTEENGEPTLWPKSKCEMELFLAPYDWHGTFDDMLEMVIQFGYTTMFVVSFPFAPFLSYLNNYLEIRLDGYRLLYETRRPQPQNVCDLGHWYSVQQIFAAIAICSNAGVIVFTGNYFSHVSESLRVWLFTLFVATLFFIKYVLETCIHDIPQSVQAQWKRQEFLIAKIIHHVPDELGDAAACKVAGICKEVYPIELATIHDHDPDEVHGRSHLSS
ncbi:unnamed protein product [Albugo candida]|uniref:Anoctamin dimerisation domain-containing protein n=1 Tax=Albugo candida TaxID=65357 RepID=A0A024G2D8_9STRA|nr:unnamed protein product [Albugo candida]|eukprot:CCI41018.1 unnamed protein product [Albugo candida]